MEIKAVRLDIPEGGNIILGQSHFIKTIEDLYEVLSGGVSGAKFGIAFCEASGSPNRMPQRWRLAIPSSSRSRMPFP